MSISVGGLTVTFDPSAFENAVMQKLLAVGATGQADAIAKLAAVSGAGMDTLSQFFFAHLVTVTPP